MADPVENKDDEEVLVGEDGEEGVVNPLSLSDEELMNMPEPTFEEEEEAPAEDPKPADDEGNEDEGESDDLDEDPTDPEDEDPEGENTDEEEPSPLDASDADLKDPDADSAPKKDDKPEPKDENPAPKKAKKKDDEEVDPAPKKSAEKSGDIDYKAEYTKLMAPFRANNKDITIKSTDDLRQLVQMGANYNKKMEALKPHLKIIRMLDNQGLMDETKLNFLIELDKKDPAAITKLIKDSGMDPLNIDVEAKSDYKSKSYTVDDNEVALADVISDIQGTDTYQATMDIVGNKWDKSSKREILDEPDILRTINTHMANGVFEEIAEVMEQDKMLGRLKGLTDLEAYKQIGAKMHADKAFKSQQEAPVEKDPEPVPAKPKPRRDSAKAKKRKLAAGGSRNQPGKTKMSDFDPLAMSDADIEKMGLADLT